MTRRAALSGDPLRLVFVATLPEPGGAAAHLIDLVNALADAGHAVSVVADPSSALWQTLEQRGGVSLTAVLHREMNTRDRRRIIHAELTRAQAHAALSVFENDYWDTGFAARAARLPAALFLHHAGMKRANRWLLPLSPWHVVVPSEDLRGWVCDLGVPRARVHVMHNAVHTKYFAVTAEHRERQRALLGFGDEDVVTGFVGRIEANKGVVPLANALNAVMQRNPHVRALWVGNGRLEPEVDRLIADGGHAAWHLRRGWTSTVLDLYAAMDMLVLPSTRRESFGRVLIEAQSCGLPVVASAIGGIPEAVQRDTTALLVPPNNVGALAAAIASLAESKSLRQAMGERGRVFVQQQFDRSRIAPEFVAWFTQWYAVATLA